MKKIAALLIASILGSRQMLGMLIRGPSVGRGCFGVLGLGFVRVGGPALTKCIFGRENV